MSPFYTLMPLSTNRRASSALMMIAMGAFIPSSGSAAELDSKALREAIDGVYTLEDWHTDSGVFQPPKADGRLVFLNGAVVFATQNGTVEGIHTVTAGQGVYEISNGKFSYTYNKWSVFSQTTSGLSASYKLPWEGFRTYSASQSGDAVALRSESGEEFLFSKTGIRYSVKGKLLRVWRRATVDK